jgi:hypothetical protein
MLQQIPRPSPPIKLSHMQMKLYFRQKVYQRSLLQTGGMLLLLIILSHVLDYFFKSLNTQILTTASVLIFYFFIVIFITLNIFFLIFTPDDASYDRWLNAQANSLYYRGLSTLGLDDRQVWTSLCLHGYVMPDDSPWYYQHKNRYDRASLCYKKDRHNNIHYSINLYLYYFLTRDDISIFYSDVNAFHQLQHIEELHHYYYEHIIGISVGEFRQINPSTYLSPDATQIEGFSFLLDNGHKIGINTTLEIHQINYGNAKIETTINSILHSLLFLIRDHKQVASNNGLKAFP